MIGGRERLIARIQQLRGPAAAGAQRPTEEVDAPPDERLHMLEARVAYLEHLLEGLQDSVHRESERHAKLIAELQAQIQPGTIGAALAEDARNRGL
jgi:uncharacterized coiled-coil protein SlyX